MADAEFSFDSDQWQKVLKKLKSKWDSIANGTSKVREEFAGIASVFVYRDVIDHFNKEASPEGKWKKWSDVYAEHMQKIGKSGNKILQDSGRLRQSFTPQSFKNTSEGTLFYNNAKTKGGFDYAAAHNDGGSVPGKPPKREFMWLSDKAIDGIARATEVWLAEDAD